MVNAMINLKINKSEANQILTLFFNQRTENDLFNVEVEDNNNFQPVDAKIAWPAKTIWPEKDSGREQKLKSFCFYVPQKHKIMLMILLQSHYNISLTECKNFVEAHMSTLS